MKKFKYAALTIALATLTVCCCPNDAVIVYRNHYGYRHVDQSCRNCTDRHCEQHKRVCYAGRDCKHVRGYTRNVYIPLKCGCVNTCKGHWFNGDDKPHYYSDEPVIFDKNKPRYYYYKD